MSAYIREHIRSNVVGYVALFIALTIAPAWAASVRSGDIKKNAVRSKHIKNKQVKTKDLKGGAVKGGKLADGAVTTGKLAANVVNGAKVADESLTGADVEGDSLGGADVNERSLAPNVLQRRIADACAPGQSIRAVAQDGSVTCQAAGGQPSGAAGGDLTGTYPNPEIAQGAVGSAKIAAAAVTIPKLGFDPATQAELNTHKASSDHDSRYSTEGELQSPGAINNGGNPVDWTKLKGVPAGFADGVDNVSTTAGDVDCAGCVHTADIAFGAVGSAQLADGAVTGAKMAPGAVDSDEIVSGAVTTLKLANSAVTAQKIAQEAVVNSRIGPLAVTSTKLANNAVLTDKLVSNAVTTAKLASDAVTSAKIADGAVGNAQLATSARAPLAGANVAADGTLTASFNRFGGAPTVDKIDTGEYVVTFPGLEGDLRSNTSIVLGTLRSGLGEIAISSIGQNPLVRTATSGGGSADRAFEIVAFLASP